ncbi:MAG: hypothetical protein WAM11_00730 [Cyanobium sp.]
MKYTHLLVSEAKTLAKPDITYRVAETESERQAYFAIREAAYAAIPGQQDGRQSAEDNGSLIIIACKSGEIMGGARIVLTRERDVLPLEKALPDYQKRLPPEVKAGQDCAEYGALALASGNKDMGLTLGLYLYSEKVARSLGLQHVFFSAELARARLYLRAYRTAYGRHESPPTEFVEICDFMPPVDSAWHVWGMMRLSVITFHYGASIKEAQA